MTPLEITLTLVIVYLFVIVKMQNRIPEICPSWLAVLVSPFTLLVVIVIHFLKMLYEIFIKEWEW